MILCLYSIGIRATQKVFGEKLSWSSYETRQKREHKQQTFHPDENRELISLALTEFRAQIYIKRSLRLFVYHTVTAKREPPVVQKPGKRQYGLFAGLQAHKVGVGAHIKAIP